VRSNAVVKRPRAAFWKNNCNGKKSNADAKRSNADAKRSNADAKRLKNVRVHHNH
jgi:hypothetical protein